MLTGVFSPGWQYCFPSRDSGSSRWCTRLGRLVCRYHVCGAAALQCGSLGGSRVTRGRCSSVDVQCHCDQRGRLETCRRNGRGRTAACVAGPGVSRVVDERHRARRDSTTHHTPSRGDTAATCQTLCDSDSRCAVWVWVVRGQPAGSADCCLTSAARGCPGRVSSAPHDCAPCTVTSARP